MSASQRSSTGTVSRPSGRLTVDRLGDGAALEVIPLDGMNIGDGRVREPHRHDYHELLWVRSGSGEHVLDGRALAVVPGAITIVGRGQVHVFTQARDLRGTVLRFGDELVLGGGSRERAAPAWLLAGRSGRSIAVPEADVPSLESTLAALEREARLRTDPCTGELERHLVSVILLWMERWYDASRAEGCDAGDAELQLYRRFAAQLDRDFPRHHDAGHYADALGVPAATLSRALTQVTGRPTKELVTDRVMLEAARLLRFTDLTIGEVAWQTGFADPLYFSRAFKRYTGDAPKAYRARVRGRSG